ncbi:MAG: hypothetical protein AAFR61_25860 [Bacteroidota bacterium]
MVEKAPYKTLKKGLLFLGGAVVFLLLLAVIAGWWFSKPLPEGQSGPEADAMARKMMEACETSAWDSVGAISWTFAGRHHLVWDKKRHVAWVDFDDALVYVDINQRTGKALVKGELQTGEAEQEWVTKAWEWWVNDAFWLNPVAKLFDPGTTRQKAEWEGEDGLLITYGSGGATPGDAYLWLMDETGKPKAWHMWVSIIPVGGLAFSWEDWISLYNGAQIATLHNGLQPIKISDVKAAESLASLLEQEGVMSIPEALIP